MKENQKVEKSSKHEVHVTKAINIHWMWLKFAVELIQCEFVRSVMTHSS